ncbi:MAG: mechanosensitive ion channel family protein, partial [Haloferacaceae archaeon]
MQAVGDLFEVLSSLPLRVWLAAGVLAVGLVAGVAVGRLVERLLHRVGVPALVEGTAFERTAGDLGTSTVAIVGALAAYFVFGLAVLAALSVVQFGYADRFWNEVTGFLPRLFVAALVLVVG